MILIYDTETTGLPPKGGSPQSSNYPKVVQLGWVCLDEGLTILGQQQLLIDPEVAIPLGASGVHGITTEIARKCGTQSKATFRAFLHVAAKAKIVVGHNISYDDNLVAHEVWRHGFDTSEAYKRFINTPRIDTNSRKLLRMPPHANGRSNMVKLGEAYEHITGETFDAHSALPDCLACGRLLKHAYELKTIDIQALFRQHDERFQILTQNQDETE